MDDVDYGEDTDHSRSWEWGYSRGYDDGWANLEYDDNPAKYEEEIENAEDYMGPGVKFCVSDFRQSQEWRWKAGRILA